MTDERAPLPDDSDATTPGTSRRGALRAAAWSVPVIAVAATAPQAAASVPSDEPPPDPDCQGWMRLEACHRDEDGDLYATVRAEVANPCDDPIEVQGFSLYTRTGLVTNEPGTVIPPGGSAFYDVVDHPVEGEFVIFYAYAPTPGGTIYQTATPDAVCD
ncbi:hypothetical protein ARHIZOSPH14_08140 [Agromyces rhizosphaerae]|uniref:Uncharacterized protein n=1 Tax=Agromyces rhizosphaerae TaxID=88374 RepID=A0A9W6CWL4_9MICO|nr:hypothetical protein [Agromyces rhizosphaerae]GLI26572.1 hypothetical protein ARHIZOSPH14_08140 [Agromyces rhizosphaerae]